MEKVLEVLKKMAQAYADLLDLKTPLGAGTSGERNTLADSLATLSSGIVTALAAVKLPKFFSVLHGVDPIPEDLLIAGFLVVMFWFILTYVLLAARDFARFRALAPLNVNLVLVWFFISLFIVIAVSYMIGTPSNRATQSIVAIGVVSALIAIHVGLAKQVRLPLKFGYAAALIVSMVVLVGRMYDFGPFEMPKTWFDFIKDSGL